MKPELLLALLFSSVACSTTPREHPRGDEDPCLFYEERWKDLTSPIEAEIKAYERHPWAGEYSVTDIGLLYMAPQSGWASLMCVCEPPLIFVSGTVVESDKGLEFRYGNGDRVSDDDFESYILDPIQAVQKWAKWERDWVDENDANANAALERWIEHLESVLKSVIAGRN